jgi:MFS family permease
MIALGLSVALLPLNSTMLAAALPAIARDVSAPPAALTLWLVTSYLLIALVLQTPAGKLSDGLGHGRGLALGQAIFAGASLVGYASKSLWLLVGARVLMAIGGALMVPSAMATVRARVPEDSRPAAFGALSAAAGVATAMGPLVGGELASRLGWSWLFLVNVPCIAVAAVLMAGHRATAAVRMPSFDTAGAVLLAVALAFFAMSVRSGEHRLVCAAAGLAALVSFGFWERRVRQPLIDFELFSLRPFLAGTLLIALQNLAVYALIFELPIVLARTLGQGSQEAGRTLLALTVSIAVFSVAGGRLARRVGERTTTLIGCGSAVLGMVLLAFVPIAWATVGLIVLGAGTGLATPSAQAAGLNAVPAEKSGVAVGVGTTTRYLGGAVGMAVVTALVEGGEPLSRHRVGTVVFAVALVLAMVCGAMLPGGRRAPTARLHPSGAASPRPSSDAPSS